MIREQESLALPSRVHWEVGQNVYRRFLIDPDKPRDDPDNWDVEPWWITKVGPKRIQVEDVSGEIKGYVDRAFLESHGTAVVYGAWRVSKGVVYAEWSDMYVRYRLAIDARRAVPRLDSDTLGGRMRLDRRIDALRVFGLDVTADATTIRRTYRSLVMQTHPDRGGDAALFRRIQESYEVLSGEWKPSLADLLRELERRMRSVNATTI